MCLILHQYEHDIFHPGNFFANAGFHAVYSTMTTPLLVFSEVRILKISASDADIGIYLFYLSAFETHLVPSGFQVRSSPMLLKTSQKN